MLDQLAVSLSSPMIFLAVAPLCGDLGPRAVPWCNATFTHHCMTEPWQYSRDGNEGNSFIWFLNFILAFVFPIIPWEIFFFIPWTIVWAAGRHIRDSTITRGKICHLIVFVNFYAGVYGGLAHPLGLIQAFQTLVGDEGICVVHPPPGRIGAIGPPFKLYYGYEDDSWCTLLALHVIFMCIVGWYFLYIIILDLRAVIAAGKRPWFRVIGFREDAPPSVLYGRAALFFFVGGMSQAAPYFGEYGTGYFGDILTSTGGYSKRPFSPGLTENLAAWSWITGGLYLMLLWMQSSGDTQMQHLSSTELCFSKT